MKDANFKQLGPKVVDSTGKEAKGICVEQAL